MSVIKKTFFFVLLIFTAGLYNGHAQKTNLFNDPDLLFKNGLDLFEREKFGAAQNNFDEYLESNANNNSELNVNAEYFSAICALRLFNKDAEKLTRNFIKNNPESPKVRLAYFQLGNYTYYRKKYDKSIEYYSHVDPYDLNKAELGEYKFKYGYSYFVKKEFDKASSLFYDIKDIDTKYAPSANYYFAHVAYQNKNWETALKSFLKLVDYDQFAHIIPYYITQIYYHQGRYEQIKKYSPPLLDAATTKRAPEIARVIGEAYYRTNDFVSAIKYLEIFRDKSFDVSREDQYQLGYAYHKTGKNNQAVDMLGEIVYYEDSLTQHAHYMMGDSYVKLKKKRDARNAFYSASKFNYDKSVEEDALFNYAKLSYELAYNPYNQAIKALKKYIKKYPRSGRIDEAYGYLVKVFLTTKNYKGALDAIENIKLKNEDLRKAYQRVSYQLALKLMNNGSYKDAIGYFDKSMIYKSDRDLVAQAHFWKGESYYRMGENVVLVDSAKGRNYLDEAILNYQDFIFSNGAIHLPIFNTASYHIAYAYFQGKEYDNAITWFRKFVNAQDTEVELQKKNDAYNRLGDAYFIKRKQEKSNIERAIEYYGFASEIGKVELDYSLFQKATSQGFMQGYEKKVATLSSLLENFNQGKIKSKRYLIKTKYELGGVYQQLNKDEEALKFYQDIVDNHNRSLFLKNSLLKIAWIHFLKDNDQEALGLFKRIVKDYPGTKESREAFNGIESICVNNADADCVKNIADSLNINLSNSKMDSVTFAAAEKSKECEEKNSEIYQVFK